MRPELSAQARARAGNKPTRRAVPDDEPAAGQLVLGPASLPDAGRCSVSGVRLRLGPNVDACSKPGRVAERALACLCGVHPDSLPAGPKKDWTGKHPYLTVAHSILRHLHSNVVRPGRLCDARRGRDCVSLAHGCMTCNVAHREPRFGTEIAHAADFADGGLFLDDFDAVLDMGGEDSKELLDMMRLDSRRPPRSGTSGQATLSWNRAP